MVIKAIIGIIGSGERIDVKCKLSKTRQDAEMQDR